MFTLLALMFFLLVLMVRVGSLRPDFLFDRMMCWLTWILAFKGLLQKTRSIDLLFVSNGSLARPAVFYSWLARRLCLFKTLTRSLGLLLASCDSLTQLARSLFRLARRRCFSAKLTRSTGVLFVSNGSLYISADLAD
jgi:hypothetical protein